ncbi:MAG TPA: hypothetical protein PLI09_09730 [Candidatus Hydrogenedentes bacterium]|nr:hypothetical protein [Candidatus Hydrogenedentota bacterium]
METFTTGIDWCWYRFRECVFDDEAAAIRPASGAAPVRYSPWDEYRQWRADGSAAQPPYMPLLELARETEGALRRMVESDGTVPPSADVINRWCKWFSTYGMLGLLPHGLHQITQEADVAASRRDKARADGESAVLVHSRFGGDWREMRRTAPRAETGGKGPGGRVRGRHLWIDVHEYGAYGPGVEHYEGEEATDYLSDYFSLIPATDLAEPLYPLPLTGRFWACYREPLTEVFRAVLVLYDAVASVLGGENAQGGCAKLNGLLGETSVRLRPSEDGKFELSYSFPSLLACLACMAALDLEGQRRIFSCPECQKLFTSNAYQSSYCSTRCRNRANTREFRLRQKAIRLRAGGASDDAVAKELGVGKDRLREWWALIQPRKRKK